MNRRFSHRPPEEPDPRRSGKAEPREPVELAEPAELFDLEHSELDHRLRTMSWPTAPPGAKERVLRAVLAQAATGFPALQAEAGEPSDDEGPTEQVDRFELSRFRNDILADRVLKAPRLQPRYASVL